MRAVYSADDECDSNPQVSGFGGFSIDSGDMLKIDARKKRVLLSAPAIDLSVTAKDSSGNTRQVLTTLQINP